MFSICKSLLSLSNKPAVVRQALSTTLQISARKFSQKQPTKTVAGKSDGKCKEESSLLRPPFDLPTGLAAKLDGEGDAAVCLHALGNAPLIDRLLDGQRRPALVADTNDVIGKLQQCSNTELLPMQTFGKHFLHSFRVDANFGDKFSDFADKKKVIVCTWSPIAHQRRLLMCLVLDMLRHKLSTPYRCLFSLPQEIEIWTFLTAGEYALSMFEDLRNHAIAGGRAWDSLRKHPLRFVRRKARFWAYQLRRFFHVEPLFPVPLDAAADPLGLSALAVRPDGQTDRTVFHNAIARRCQRTGLCLDADALYPVRLRVRTAADEPTFRLRSNQWDEVDKPEEAALRLDGDDHAKFFLLQLEMMARHEPGGNGVVYKGDHWHYDPQEDFDPNKHDDASTAHATFTKWDESSDLKAALRDTFLSHRRLWQLGLHDYMAIYWACFRQRMVIADDSACGLDELADDDTTGPEKLSVAYSVFQRALLDDISAYELLKSSTFVGSPPAGGR